MSESETRENYAKQFPELTKDQLDGRIQEDKAFWSMDAIVEDLHEFRAFERFKMASRTAEAAVGYLVEFLLRNNPDDIERLPPDRDVLETTVAALDILIRDAASVQKTIRLNVQSLDSIGWWKGKGAADDLA